MPPRIVRVPGIERVEIPQARQSVPLLHDYLRARILDGTLPPGTKLSQATLAEQLGCSRTPLREVLRMLQDEGLLTGEPNQRMLVTGLDPVDLDSDYASRILLGSLALGLTIERFRSAERREAQKSLTRMRRAARRKDVDDWLVGHADFHRLFDAGAPEPLRRQLDLLADRSVRYIRIRQDEEPARWAEVGDVEHPAILEAVVAGDRAAAISALAHHLADTALRVLARSAPEYRATAVPQALSIVECEGTASGVTTAVRRTVRDTAL